MMLQKWKDMKRSGKKGFTLVELIVVLVILAILAALLIPALTGYIDKANEKKIVAETRLVVMAAQTLTSEAYGAGITSGYVYSHGSDVIATDKSITNGEIGQLAEFKPGAALTLSWDGATVSGATYNDGTYTCTYSNGVYTTKKTSNP